MLSDDKVKSINELANSLISTPIDNLVTNTANWGAINFEPAREDLNLLFSLCNHLQSLPISILPESIADKIIEAITKAGATITKIKGFDIQNGNPAGTKEQIITEIKVNAENLLNVTKEWIPFLAYQKGDVQKNIEELSTAVSQADAILSKSVADTEATKKQIDGIIVAAREASASAGVGVFTTDFESQASTLDSQAVKWLYWTMGMAASTLIAAVIFIFLPIDKDATHAQIFQYITSKIVLFLVLITATVWSGRIYKALKHQVTVNKHRANALKTFQAFVKAASDETTRDAVLLETTNSIFSSSPSGYLDATESSSGSSKKIYEIVKASAEINKSLG